MGLLAETIATCGRRGRGFAERAAASIPAELFARKPRAEGRVIDTNHPAFIYGHLALYPARILMFLGRDPSGAAPLPRWAELFSPGKPCEDDAEGRIYPPAADLLAACFRAYDALLAVLPEVPDEALAAPVPDERFRAMLPTVGAATLSMLNNHLSFHMGQLSAWRRCMGLAPVAM